MPLVVVWRLQSICILFAPRVRCARSLGRELYDHRGDSGKWLDWPGENLNLVNHTAHAAVVEDLHNQLLEYIQIK